MNNFFNTELIMGTTCTIEDVVTCHIVVCVCVCVCVCVVCACGLCVCCGLCPRMIIIKTIISGVVHTHKVLAVQVTSTAHATLHISDMRVNCCCV